MKKRKAACCEQGAQGIQGPPGEPAPPGSLYVSSGTIEVESFPTSVLPFGNVAAPVVLPLFIFETLGAGVHVLVSGTVTTSDTPGSMTFTVPGTNVSIDSPAVAGGGTSWWQLDLYFVHMLGMPGQFNWSATVTLAALADGSTRTSMAQAVWGQVLEGFAMDVQLQGADLDSAVVRFALMTAF